MSSTTIPQTPAEFVETMLRSSIEADRLMAEYINDGPLRQAEQQAAVNGFVAGVALENLHRFAPDAAKAAAQVFDGILTAGDLGGPAYRAAKKLGHDPDQWIAEFEERAALRKARLDRSRLLERVVVQHIADGLDSGDPAAAVLARSLLSELDAAGLDMTTAVNALREHQADEQRSAGA